jgi:hypothetical protein
MNLSDNLPSITPISISSTNRVVVSRIKLRVTSASGFAKNYLSSYFRTIRYCLSSSIRYLHPILSFGTKGIIAKRCPIVLVFTGLNFSTVSSAISYLSVIKRKKVFLSVATSTPKKLLYLLVRDLMLVKKCFSKGSESKENVLF